MRLETLKLYEDREDVTLTAYLVADQGELRGQGKRPAVLICPGGAYIMCSDREGEPVALAFAAMGYHAFVLRYSTWGEGKPGFPDLTKLTTPKPGLTHPTPVREVGMAMLLIRQHAEEWLVDMDRVAVCGFSAGGHNAGMYGVYWDKPLVTEYLGVDKELIRPAALILGYMISDYVYMRELVGENVPTQGFFAASNTAFFGMPAPDFGLLEETSPARLVGPNTPPAFLWATSTDELVPVQNTLRMAAALADQGIPYELHIFERGSHGLSVGTQASAIARSMISPDAAKWVGLADAWLQKRFALKLPAAVNYGDMII